MRCLMCKKEFFIKKSFSNLFKEERLFICDSCKRKIPFKLEFSEVPLKNHLLRIVSSQEYKKFQNNYAYINEMSIVRERLKEIRKNDFEIIDDNFVLSEKKLSELELLSEMLDKDIMIVTSTYQIV